jgi:hypothetical protein
MKNGANFQDINQIKLGFEQGMSAEELSSLLNISLSCVASFAPPEEKPKRKKREPKEAESESPSTEA